jgi:signal peptidase I
MSTMTLSAEAAPPRPRSRLLAAVLSLLAPGVGHLYIGQRRRALIIVVLNVVLFLAFFAGAFVLPPTFQSIAIYGVAGIAALLIFYFGSVIDAVRLARRDDAAPRLRWYVLLGAVLAIWAGNFAIEATGPAIKRHMPWRTFSVASGSMQPTLQTGEWFLADTRHYASHAPARGDLVTYRLPSDESTIYIKRIVALPGDRIAFRDNRAVVNGVVQAEPFADLSGANGFYATTAEVTVPADHIFVAGDNRANSSDSRVKQHGFVPVKNLTGRATEIVLSEEGERFGLWIGTPAK